MKQSISDDVLKHHRDMREQIENEAVNLAKERLNAEIEMAERKKNTEMMNAEASARNNAVELRKELKSRLFSDVYNKIKDYKNTNDYKEALHRSILALFEKTGGSIITVSLDESDMELKDYLEQSENIKIISGGDIIGGFKATIQGKNILFDYSYKTRLEEAKASFTLL